MAVVTGRWGGEVEVIAEVITREQGKEIC